MKKLRDEPMEKACEWAKSNNYMLGIYPNYFKEEGTINS